MTADASRTFHVIKDDGSHWNLQYTAQGTRWTPIAPLAQSSTSAAPYIGPGPGPVSRPLHSVRTFCESSVSI